MKKDEGISSVSYHHLRELLLVNELLCILVWLPWLHAGGKGCIYIIPSSIIVGAIASIVRQKSGLRRRIVPG